MPTQQGKLPFPLGGVSEQSRRYPNVEYFDSGGHSGRLLEAITTKYKLTERTYTSEPVPTIIPTEPFDLGLKVI